MTEIENIFKKRYLKHLFIPQKWIGKEQII